jgi:hypothetical protein
MHAESFHRDDPDSRSGAALAMFAEVAAATGTPGPAALLYEMLLPFRERLITVVLGLTCLGAADRYLGMLATLLERFDDAAAHFDRAVSVEERIHGHALVPRTLYWEARLMQARGASGSARALAGRVVEETERLGMSRLQLEAAALLGD